jgi:transglutaminase-like putative cysteine protease
VTGVQTCALPIYVSGNEASVTARVNILSAEYTWVEEKAEEVLGRITSDDMTQREKAKAIYVYMRSNIRYSAAPETYDTYEGAYFGFSHGYGDCFTFYAMSEVLLTHAGIDNMRIQRIPEAPVNHFWNLVNLGEGWYHFDTTPPFVPCNGFMLTESEARAYANLQAPYRANYLTYIKEDYPEVVQ